MVNMHLEADERQEKCPGIFTKLRKVSKLNMSKYTVYPNYFSHLKFLFFHLKIGN
jgi:hypothetical protein